MFLAFYKSPSGFEPVKFHCIDVKVDLHRKSKIFDFNFSASITVPGASLHRSACTIGIS